MQDDSLVAHYENTFGSQEGELYAPLAGFDLAAHNRRMEILAGIDLPDLTEATVMDYGVGSWGFACIFDRLKQCAHPIGVDISRSAIERSIKVSRNDPLLAGKTVTYLTSQGYNIDLPNNSCDVIFCGECIEHVEDTDGFLSEFHRILKPGGTAIFTTPNASPYVYRQLGLKWCAGFEHVALMDYDEFVFWLGKYFEVERVFGFNQTILPGVDTGIADAVRQKWATSALDDPRNATSLIAKVRKPFNGREWPKREIATVGLADMKVFGTSEIVPLVSGIEGLKIEPGSSIEIPVPAGYTHCNLIMWSHDWSGICEIVSGTSTEIVDLYGHVGGCARVRVSTESGGKVEIRPTLQKNPMSSSTEAIVYRAVFSRAKLRR
ncbi:class I SAM-dependent methyltransferase [Sphingomonas sp. RB3P16]|uniref:class I SAM-dependent methyltransferase n=1 Tax=Parasphingomonas frigoris TaxID=3096163 RepID=UPI002FC663B8